jgi:hypothetical protein
MAGIPFSPNSPDLEAVRQIIFARLRGEAGQKQLDYAGSGYRLELLGKVALLRCFLLVPSNIMYMV